MALATQNTQAWVDMYHGHLSDDNGGTSTAIAAIRTLVSCIEHSKGEFR